MGIPAARSLVATLRLLVVGGMIRKAERPHRDRGPCWQTDTNQAIRQWQHTVPFYAAPLLLTLLGFVSPAFAQTTLSSTSLSFGNRAVGITSAAKTVTFKNTQTVALTISDISIGGGTAPSDYSWGGNCPISPSTLGAGKSCSISVTFRPSALGSRTATLTVTHSATTSPQSVALTGTGITPITPTPSPLAFGNQAQGTTSATKTETLKNAQTVPLTIADISVNGDFAQAGGTCPPFPRTLAAGASCTVLVRFSPSTTAPETGTLIILDGNPVISQQTVSLTGTGIVPVTTSTSSVSFGSVVLGNTGTAKSVSVTNRKNVSLTFASIATTGDFVITSNTCGTSVAAGASCTVKIAFKPVALGARSGILTFTDDAANSPQVVTLSGTGSAPVSLSTSSLSFGSVAVGNTSTSQSVTLTNLKSSSLHFSSITATANFKVASNTCGTRINSGASCTVSVTFAPTSLGAITGSLTFNDDASGSPQTVTLSGTGTAPVTLSPTSLTFAALTVGNVSAAQVVTLSNYLSAPLAISSALVTGEFNSTGSTCGSSVAAGASCTISMAYAPVTVGPVVGALTVSFNAFGSPLAIDLSGTGIAPISLVSLQVSPINPTVTVGVNQQFTATGTYSDSSMRDITNQVIWSSSDTTVATVAPSGVATPVAAGSSNIQATAGAVSDFTSLTVPLTVNVTTLPSTANVQAAYGLQDFTANVANDTLSGGVNWSLSGAGCSGDTCGTLSANSSASGAAVTYTPPSSVPAPAVVTLTATSVTDPTRSNSATITVVVGHIIVQQETVPISDSTTHFTYTPTYNGGAAIDLINGGSNDSGNLAPGSYTIVGSAPAGWDVTALTCSSSLGTSAVLTAVSTGTASINFAVGDTVTCTYSDVQRGHIVVQKVAVPVTDSTTQFTFTPSGYAGDTAFSLLNGGTNDSGPVTAGAYSVTESAQTGWVLTSLSCSITSRGVGTSSYNTDGVPTASITLAAGDTVTCVFTNTLASLLTTSSFTESFGDSSSLCWASGPSTCDQLWLAKGTGQSIVATPGVPPPGTAGLNSLQMMEKAGTASYIYTAGTFPMIPAGTAFDVYFTLNVSSSALGTNHTTRLLTASSSSDGSQYAAQVSFQYDGSNFRLQAGGASNVTTPNISLNAWHTIQLHVEAGTNVSYIVVDGGTQNPFTENSQKFLYLVVGSAGGNLDAITYDVGNMYINSALGGGSPSMYIDFESGLDGAQVTAATLAAGTHCGNGSWVVPTKPGLAISTNGEHPLHTPVSVCGNQYTDATGTRGLRWDMTQFGDTYAQYFYTTTSTSVSAGFFFMVSDLSQIYNWYSIFDIDGANGIDYAVLHIHGGAMYLETDAGITNAIPVTANTWYWVTLQYNAGGTHYMQVYETTNWTLYGSASGPSTGTDLPNQIRMGRTGSEDGYPKAYWYYDNVVVDYGKAKFPLLP